MTNKEKKEWLSVKYPLTIIRDRYDGTYSGAMWLAFPLDRDEVPEDVDGEDSECMYFWKNYQEPVGKGAYASDAVADLIQQMRKSEPEESEDGRIRKWLLDYAIETIAGLESDISLSTYDGIKGHDPEAEAELAQWQKARAYLEKQKDKSKEKSFIWTKHDEAVRKEAISCLTEWRDKKCIPYGYLVDCNNILAWLEDELPEKIEKQKEQKPAEWSEELAILEGYIISGDWSDAHKERALDILKSLRPSWKPSEEQMEEEK